jgi:hypothetical protein
MNYRFFFLVSLMAFLLIPTVTTAQENPAATAAAPPALTPTVNPATAPLIYFKKPKHDFGEVVEGPDITHDFYFHNRGKSVLHIDKAETSCGCTAAVLGGKNDIPPGGRGIIKVTYHTQGRPWRTAKTITVFSNDPVHPNYALEIGMTVVREVEIQPERITFVNARRGTKQTTLFKVLGRPEKPLKVLSVESVNKRVSVTGIKPYRDEKAKRDGAEVELTLPDTYPITVIDDELIVKTDDVNKPEARASVTADVVGRVQYEPKNLSFVPHQAAPATISFNVSEKPGDFAVRKLETKNKLVRPYFKKVRGTSGEERCYLIVSVLKDIPRDSDGKDEITVFTNDEEQPQITIGVQATH